MSKKDIGWSVTAQWMGELGARKNVVKLTTSSSPLGICLSPAEFEKLREFYKDNGVVYAFSDNDKGKGREADYITTDTETMAKEIMANSPERGVRLAFNLLRNVGWEGPSFPHSGGIQFNFRGAGPSNELQPESAVDPKPERDEPDPWQRIEQSGDIG